MRASLGVVWPFFLTCVTESEIVRPDVALCSGWLQSQGEWERTEVRTDPNTTVSGLCLLLFLGMRPVPMGCSVCMSWASDAAGMLGQSHLEMWWKLSTSACAVWRAGHAGRGMAHVKVVPIGFLTGVFSLYPGVFLLSGSCESWSHSPGQWVVPGQQHGWRMAEGKGEEGLCSNWRK